LAECGFPVKTARDHYGNTMLLLAAQNNSRRLIKLSLKHGGGVDAVNLKGNTALHYAMAYGYEECSKTLRKYGARVDIRNLQGDICFTAMR